MYIIRNIYIYIYSCFISFFTAKESDEEPGMRKPVSKKTVSKKTASKKAPTPKSPRKLLKRPAAVLGKLKKRKEKQTRKENRRLKTLRRQNPREKTEERQ